LMLISRRWRPRSSALSGLISEPQVAPAILGAVGVDLDLPPVGGGGDHAPFVSPPALLLVRVDFSPRKSGVGAGGIDYSPSLLPTAA